MITPEILLTPPYLQALLGYVMLFTYLLFFNYVMRVKRINQIVYWQISYCLRYFAYYFIVKL